MMKSSASTAGATKLKAVKEDGFILTELAWV